MKLTRSESRALGFIGFLVLLSTVGRWLDRPRPITLDGPAVNVAKLEADSRALLEQPGPKPLGRNERIDPNRASMAELERLPGVGKGVAERIVGDRKKNGAYRTVEDLTRVSGIGPATVEKWADHLKLPRAPAQRARVTRRTSSSSSGRSRDAPDASPVNVGRATAAELERLPGIGPALARRIIAHRDSVGGIHSMEELQKVRGIGPVLAQRLAPLIRFGT